MHDLFLMCVLSPSLVNITTANIISECGFSCNEPTFSDSKLFFSFFFNQVPLQRLARGKITHHAVLFTLSAHYTCMFIMQVS